MAITTIDGVVAGMQPPIWMYKTFGTFKAVGAWASGWNVAGYPGSSSAIGTGTSGTSCVASLAGGVPFTNPVSGNTYLARWVVSGGAVGSAVLADRLWHNASVSPSTTSTQTFGSGNIPPRDANGASAGDGVLVGLEYGVGAQNGATNAGVLYYVNSAGVSDHVASWTGFTSATLGQFIPCTLQAGDVGVRRVQGIVLQVSNTGASINVVLYRPLAYVPVAVANVASGIDAVTGGMVRLYDNSVPFVLYQAAATTALNLAAQLVYTQG